MTDKANAVVKPSEIRGILDDLRLAGIPFVLLRHRELSPSEMFQGDYDFLIDDRDTPRFLKVLMTSLADRRHLFLLHNPGHPLAHKSTVRIFDPVAGKFVTLEFWHEFVTRERPIMGALRWKDLEWAIEETGRGRELRSDVGALLYLIHLGAKQKDRESPLVGERLRRYSEEIAELDGPLAEAARTLIDDIAANHIDLKRAYPRAVSVLAEHVGLHGKRSAARLQLRSALVDYPRVIARRASRRSVAVVGPDGSGKSTLVAALLEHAPTGSVRPKVFKRFFRDRLVYKVLIRLRVGRNREKRNVWDEKMGAWLVLFALPPYLMTMIRRHKETLVLDRYFYDFLMVGIRSPDEPRGRKPLRHKLLPFVPRPGIVLNALADHSETTGRRDALPREGFESYQRQLFSFIALRPPEWFAHIPRCNDLNKNVEFALLSVHRAGAFS